MKEIVNKVKKEIELFLKNNEEYHNANIDYILKKAENNDTKSILSDGLNKIVEFNSFSKEAKTEYFPVPHYDFNDLFQDLKKGLEIGYISDINHYNLWYYIDYYQKDINNYVLKKYLQFCINNEITKEYLVKQIGYDTPDIITKFEGLELHEKMIYKGYIIEASSINPNNNKEVLVDIYRSHQQYINGDMSETISLKNFGLKQNVKEYIDKKYIDKVSLEKVKSYLNFVLGYDLLHDMIKKYYVLECDINFDFCNNLVEQFLDSEEYTNFDRPEYERLQEWLEHNQERIEKEYKKIINFEDKVYNRNLIILETGFRNNQPIALIERYEPNINCNKEYIVAYNYIINEELNNLSWGYGKYYYDKNLGLKAFKKVINGGTLAFDNREER